LNFCSATVENLFVPSTDHINHFKKEGTGDPTKFISSSSVQSLDAGLMIFAWQLVLVKKGGGPQ
jgi:hypothetical protein